MHHLQWLDLGIIIIIALSMLTGLFRGFVKELIALCVWVLAIWLGYHYYQQFAPWLVDYVKDKTIRSVLSFIIIAFGTLIVGGIVNATLSFILKRSGLSGTDRSLGMVFGFLRGVFMVAIIMVGVQMTSLPYKTYAKESALYARFDPLVKRLHGYMPEFIEQVKAADVNNTLSDPVSELVLTDN